MVSMEKRGGGGGVILLLLVFVVAWWMVLNCEKAHALDTTQVSRLTFALQDAQRKNADEDDDKEGGCFVTSLRRELKGRDCSVALADGDHHDRGCRIALALMNCELRAAKMEPVACNEHESCGACALHHGRKRNWWNTGAASLLHRLLRLSESASDNDGNDSLTVFAIYQSWRQSAFAACQLITEHETKRTLIEERRDATIFAAEMRDVLASGRAHVKSMVDEIRDAIAQVADKLEHVDMAHDARLAGHLEKLSEADANAERAASATAQIRELVEPTARKLEDASVAAASVYAYTTEMIQSIELHRSTRAAFATMGFFAASCIVASFVTSALRRFAHAMDATFAHPMPYTFSAAFDTFSSFALLALLAAEALIVVVRATTNASTMALLGIDAFLQPSTFRRLFIVVFLGAFCIQIACIAMCAITTSARWCIGLFGVLFPLNRAQSAAQKARLHARRAHLGVERYSIIDHSGRLQENPDPDVVASLLRQELDRKLDAMVEDRQQALLTQQMIVSHKTMRSLSN